MFVPCVLMSEPTCTVHDPSLWILIPAYNAAASLAQVIARARPLGVPILIVDDGSTDETAQVARVAGAQVLRHPGNRGKGAALATGFAYARQRGALGVITLDADGQHDPAELPALIAAWQRAPDSLVLGVRSFDPTLMPRRSRIGNQISTFFISRYTGRLHKDTQTGFRIYPQRLLAIPLRSRRFDTEAELLLWASKLHVPLVEVPISTIYDPACAGVSAPPAGSPAQAAAAQTKFPTHFRNWEDTLRMIRLVFFSPLWRAEQALSDSELSMHRTVSSRDARCTSPPPLKEATPS